MYGCVCMCGGRAEQFVLRCDAAIAKQICVQANSRQMIDYIVGWWCWLHFVSVTRVRLFPSLFLGRVRARAINEYTNTRMRMPMAFCVVQRTNVLSIRRPGQLIHQRCGECETDTNIYSTHSLMWMWKMNDAYHIYI